MKAKSFFAALFVAVSAVAFAGPGNPKVVVVNQKQSGTFKVIYEGEKVGNVTMTIRNGKSQVVFTETIRNIGAFARPVNFTGMEAGEYSIEITDASGKQVQKISYNVEAPVKNVHVARINEEGKYLLAVPGNGPEQINVRIFDGANQLVHEEDLTINGATGLVYNLRNVQGMPTFEVTDQTGNVKTIKY